MLLVNGRYVDEENLEEEPVLELVTSGREPIRVSRWLVAALAVSVMVAGVLAGLMYREHQQSPDERAVAEVISRSMSAWNAADGTAALKTMTPHGTWTSVGDPAAPATSGPFSGADLAEVVDELDEVNFQIATTGPLTISAGASSWTAVRPIHVSWTRGDHSVQQDGWSLATVVDDHGTKLISKITFWATDSRG